MKGRRKVKTDKWAMIQEYTNKARSILANKANTSSGFLKFDHEKADIEPLGKLAGKPRSLPRHDR